MRTRCAICGYFVHERYNGEVLFRDWLANILSFYLVDTERHVVVYTDNSRLKKFESGQVSVICVEDDFSDIGENRLKKIRYLKRLSESKSVTGVDIVSFIQSNIRCKRAVRVRELLPEGIDISAPVLPEFAKTKDFRAFYHNEYATPEGVSNTDIGGIDCSRFTYYQDGHIICRTECFKMLIGILNDMIEDDQRRGVRIIGQPFDERYFNYYLNVTNDRHFKVNGLVPKFYNNRNGRSHECRIFQIDKSSSSLFQQA